MFGNLPPWVPSLALLILMLLGRELGYLLHRRGSEKVRDIDDSKAEFALSAVLGLLALLIGFTFSLALSRYEIRRDLVVLEANAMGTTWLRFDLLEPAQRDKARELMKQYAAARLAYGSANDSADAIRSSRQADDVQRRLWSTLAGYIEPYRSTALAPLLLGPANEMIDLAGKRTAAVAAHIPNRLVGTLALYCFVAAGLIGYLRGRYRMATTLVFILVVLALGLVADLDMPTKGLVRVSQEPIAAFLRSTEY